MINACELCKLIAIKKVLKEAEDRELVKEVIEKKFTPIFEGMTEIPERYRLGYVYDNCFYLELTEWEVFDRRGWVKREFTNRIIKNLYESYFKYFVEYLFDFGFKLEVEEELIVLSKTSKDLSIDTEKVKTFYVSLSCPLEG